MVRITGGGISGNKVVQNRGGGKVEPKTHAGNVASVAQQGMSTAFRKEPITQGKGYEPQKMGDTGIAKATYNPATSGPGSLRTTYASGSQSPTPPAREMLAGRQIFEGPESVTSRGRGR
jgi:hypothetical protein